jgi:D-alanyl-D-alanine carboxypeptidase
MPAQLKKKKENKFKGTQNPPPTKAPIFKTVSVSMPTLPGLPSIASVGKKAKVPVFVVLMGVLAVSALVSLPQAVDLAQSKVLAQNMPNNKVLAPNSGNVAGIAKQVIVPKPQGLTPPTLTSTAALVKDLDSDTVLFVKDPEKRVAIASTTKIMTAMVGADYYSLDTVLTVKNSQGFDGSTMGLKVGEQLTFKNLLFGLMLNSGNDAAFTIAANYPGGVSSFIAAMNAKAQSIGLKDTHFDNPAGFDSPYHYSSALDLAKMATIAIKNETFSRIIATKETEVASVDLATTHSLKNLNKLLGTDGVLGIKTGTTPVAKENFVGLVEKNNHRILTVVLGSDDRFGETENLIDWTYKNFIWQQ